MGKKKNNNNNYNGNNNNDDNEETKNKENKNEGEEKNNEGGDNDQKKKKDEKNPITMIYKVDMHCEGCASKIVKCVRGFDGVESAKADTGSNKLTIIGFGDPSKIRDKFHQKTKKKIELISPQPKKEKDKENDNKSNEKKPDEKKPKEPAVTTAVLKVGLHCQGCIDRIHKMVTKTKGVKEMSVDKEKDLITVMGTMDIKALTQTLKEKLKRTVEIVPPKKEKENKESNDGDNNKDNGGGGGKKKGGGGGGDGGQQNGGKMEGNKMEYMGQPVMGYGYGYPPPGYDHGYGYGYPVGLSSHAPQMFSDENPNACSIM